VLVLGIWKYTMMTFQVPGTAFLNILCAKLYYSSQLLCVCPVGHPYPILNTYICDLFIGNYLHANKYKVYLYLITEVDSSAEIGTLR
jgi:hypothetical protein